MCVWKLKDIFSSGGVQWFRKFLLAAAVAWSPLQGFSQEPTMTEFTDLGVRVAKGFDVSLFADSDLADDIYSMTLDARGRVVVSGPGYVRILHDLDDDGKADRATNFARLESGAMGMCFVENNLYLTAADGLLRYDDKDGNGFADGPPEKLFGFHFGEHGAHAIRQGPDGWLYVVCGNDSGLENVRDSRPNPPVKRIEAGAILRFKPDGGDLQVFAHGFRNPYDFDFNLLGDIFTYDSDCEREVLLPWYLPTRIYHVETYGHHGWRLGGWTRGWHREEDYLDTVELLSPAGRSSPTGVVNYRHFQFPAYFQNGLFACDWTFGRVYFWPLLNLDSTYNTEARLLLEPIGANGFAPTDIVVAPDGSLLVCVGGRNTRGAVYRIVWKDREEMPAPTTEMQAVLNAPQPLQAWSRRQWVPLARALKAPEFHEVILQEKFNPAARIRAVEVMTELFDGLPMNVAWKGANDPSAFVRARVAWSVGRFPKDNFKPVIKKLLQDKEPLVRRRAADALTDQAGRLSNEELVDLLPGLFEDDEPRIRRAAARIATFLSEDAWKQLGDSIDNRKLRRKLTYILAMIWRAPEQLIHPEAARRALEVLKLTRNDPYQMEAARLVVLALGDFNLRDPSLEVYSGYELAGDLTEMDDEFLEELRETVRLRFPTNNERLDEELSRLAAMLEIEDPVLIDKVINRLRESSTATSDFHYLAVLSRLPGPRSEKQSGKVAQALVNLDVKLEGRQQRPKQVWNDRLLEVFGQLQKRDPLLATSLLLQPDFRRVGNLPLVQALPSQDQQMAAKIFLTEVKDNPDFPWTPQLVRLLARLQTDAVKGLFRKQYANNYAVRDAVTLALANDPEEIDRLKFLNGLASPDKRVVRASLSALMELPSDATGEHLVPALQLLRRLLAEPAESGLRKRVVDLIIYQTKAPIKIREEATDPASLRQAYQPTFDWFVDTHANLEQALELDQRDDPVRWTRKLNEVPWNVGDADRGREIFEQRRCQTCHAGNTAIGPDLSGVTARFSVNDLFQSIVFPHREVAPAYRPRVYQLTDGQTVYGMPVFLSAEGVMLRTGPGATVRIANDRIAAQREANFSLMPGGLLDGLTLDQLAHLYAYLKTL